MLKVYNALGACLFRSSLEGTKARATWNGCAASGVYCVTVEDAEQQKPGIVIKESFSLVK